MEQSPRFNTRLTVLHWLCCLAVGLLILSQGAGAQERAAASDINFASTEHDFGAIMDVETYQTAFPFVNSGTGSLVIKQVKAGCGCTTPALDKKVFAPGEASEIKVSFKPKGSGRQTKRITVYTNDPETPVITLAIKADITPFVTATPKMVRFQSSTIGTGDQAVVQLAALDPQFSVNRVYMSGLASRYFSAQLLPRPEGITDGPRSVLVSLSPEAPWGAQYATLNVEVEGKPTPESEPVTHVAKVTTSAKISGTLQPSATMFQVGIVEPGETFSKTITLRNVDRKEYQVLSATIDKGTVGDMEVAFVPSPSGLSNWLLVLTGTPGRTEQPIRGDVTIYTDVPGEEELVIRIGGMARTGGASAVRPSSPGQSKP
ncbi:MAG: DUF1573 domain-containing protein [Phycisphaerales bacterium]|nr:DUF1573 domain-containing protein [Phycisphaerales bacterium]